MGDNDRGTVAEAKRHPVMLRLSQMQVYRLRRIAQQRDVPMATAARQLVQERLDQLNGHAG